MKRTISVIHQDETTEIQWGKYEPADGQIQGYLLIHEDGSLTVPFRTSEDEPFVFVLDTNGARIVGSEDQPPDSNAVVVWGALRPYNVFPA